MSIETGVFALVNIRHHGKDYEPGEKIGRISKADVDRLLQLKAVRVVEEVVKEPPKTPNIPPPPPKKPGGESDPPKDPPADPPGESDKKGKEKQ